ASRFLIELPPQANIGAGAVAPFPSISPDGRYIAFVAGEPNSGGPRLWIRPVDSLNAQALVGTGGLKGTGSSTAYYFWSPDSHFIGFFAGSKLKKVAVAGAPPQVLCDVTNDTVSGSWNSDNVILFEHDSSLYRVGAAGGVSTPVRQPD